MRRSPGGDGYHDDTCQVAQQPRVESRDWPRPRHQDPGLHQPGGAEAGGYTGRHMEHQQPAHVEQGGHIYI